MLTLALNKGRILDEVLPLLATAGLDPLEDPRQPKANLRNPQSQASFVCGA